MKPFTVTQSEEWQALRKVPAFESLLIRGNHNARHDKSRVNLKANKGTSWSHYFLLFESSKKEKELTVPGLG